MDHENGIDIILLTKPPQSDLARLCHKMLAKSDNAVLYLAGDGVYNLFRGSIEAIGAYTSPRKRIIACKEDMEARGIPSNEKVTVPSDFFGQLVEEMMDDKNRIRVF
jgi:tRNA 2-thiouridine synthesizing protein B